ncbi:hypothetical protein ACIRRA_26655 [Nocardia sp. NPDC101769]|uniref:hypothetical protein n=1 Tax=Nocardia sp. NPDC101769 TaxID=3364333 RepID=UPI00381AF0EC
MIFRCLALAGSVSAVCGYFGTDTGAAATLLAATHPWVAADAVVSRSGRPDLARNALARVQAPTLLIVGGHDPTTLTLNQRAQAAMPGALETAADLTRDWFLAHLTHSRRPEHVTASPITDRS